MTTSALHSPAAGTPASRQNPLPGARLALITLLLINLFNYIDRQVLASVVEPIEVEFFPQQSGVADKGAHGEGKDWVEAKLGSLQTAFMFSYILIAPLFGWLGDRISRWFLIGV